jgi:hypothetical protein
VSPSNDVHLVVGQADQRRPAERHRRGALEDTIGSRPHLRGRELHALLERLRELQEQLFERDRAHMRAERLEGSSGACRSP